MAVCDEELEGRTADVDILVEAEEERTADVVILVGAEEEGTADVDILVETEEERTADVVILVETEEEGTSDVVILDVIEETAEASADVTCELDIVEAVDGLGKKVVSATDSLDGHRKVVMAVVGFGVSGAAVGVLLTFKSFTQQ